MSDKKIVSPGVNAFKCICGDGTVFISVPPTLMARLRCGEMLEVSGKCHLHGHTQRYNISAWPPYPFRRE